MKRTIAKCKYILLYLFVKVSGIFGFDTTKYDSGLIIKRRASTDYRFREHIYEHLYVNFIKQLITKEKIDLIVDVGSNEGQFAQFMRNKVGYRGRICSFEPIPRVFDVLNENAADDENWDVYNFALGDKQELKEINISRLSVFSSFLEGNEYLRTTYGDMSGHLDKVTVKIEVLEDIWELMGSDSRHVFLKMDTQGFDLNVFHGLRTMVDRVSILQSELSIVPIYDDMPDWIDSITCFAKQGFKLANLYPVVIDDALNRVVEFDCIFLKEYNEQDIMI